MRTRNKFDRDNYIKCKNKLRSLTRNLRSEFERNLIGNIKNNPKSFWKYDRSRLTSRSMIPSLEKLDNTIATSSRDKAETLNNFFNSVFTTENVHNIPTISVIDNVVPVSDIVIDSNIVKNKFDQLDPSKSSEPDKWHPLFLKEQSNELCIPLSIVFKKSLETGAHNSWTDAIIVAIHKKGAKSKPGNYRPISITSAICKVMERILRDSNLQHMMPNGLFSDAQYGFVPGRDCMTQLLICIEEWTEMLERGEAFDSVPRQRLLLKLQEVGIAGKLLDWIRSFLNGRRQYFL